MGSLLSESRFRSGRIGAASLFAGRSPPPVILPRFRKDCSTRLRFSVIHVSQQRRFAEQAIAIPRHRYAAVLPKQASRVISHRIEIPFRSSLL
jgi:hypothetical protein